VTTVTWRTMSCWAGWRLPNTSVAKQADKHSQSKAGVAAIVRADNVLSAARRPADRGNSSFVPNRIVERSLSGATG
jgi:hypothetical protein